MATEIKPPADKSRESNRDQLVVDRAQNFWAKNSKVIIYVLTGVILLVGGYLIYKNYFQAPEERKATEAMWKAEEYFRMDSARLALQGDGANQGFLRIITKYKSTRAGNLARFYAGASYLKLGDYTNAIKHLKEFDTDEKLLQVRAEGLLGDAYAESGNKKQAVEHYKKAATMNENDNLNSPEYLFRAGLLYQDLGNNKEAINMYRTIKDKYPTSQRGIEIDKYLARLGEVK